MRAKWMQIQLSLIHKRLASFAFNVYTKSSSHFENGEIASQPIDQQNIP